ncbi:hypothetical protein A1507_03645 [Methylomonas koyamae]|uniref:Uncharacterized protein n=1 Tax=Methylomonas koyamae TaxID=702114 RepID=A0A177MXF8_9GAMM|nr:hypothetical protein [Methylomonas koyamae]OAI10398.1 hypothetical protein A1507_03645 [Methylomonas koyamae]
MIFTSLKWVAREVAQAMPVIFYRQAYDFYRLYNPTQASLSDISHADVCKSTNRHAELSKFRKKWPLVIENRQGGHGGFALKTLLFLSVRL